MNMGCPISNLTIIVMTVIVVFCNVSHQEYDWKEMSVYAGPEERAESQVCIENLQRDGYFKRNSGFENFQTKIQGLHPAPRNRRISLEDYKKTTEQEINRIYKLFYGNVPENYDVSRKSAYFCHMAIHVLNTENILPILTWCEIHGNGTYDANEFLSKNNTNYKQYLRRIAKDTGVSRKEQTLVYRTIDVCHNEITNTLTYAYFLTKYNNISNEDFKPDPLNWCAINVCYELLTDAGFLDVSAKQNIQEVMLPTFEIKETHGYIYEFYQYLVNLRKQPTDHYQIVNPNDREIEIKVGYPRNWCGAQVCHADLMSEGYLHEHVTDNYIYVLPSIKEKILSGQILSKFVIDFSSYLELTILMSESFDFSEPDEYNIPANKSPKSPLEWCKFTVVPYKEE